MFKIALILAAFCAALSSASVIPKASISVTDEVGGFALFRRDSGVTEWLLMEKAKEPGDWSPPKGNADAGELPFDAAIREMREETTLVTSHYQVLLQYYEYFEYTTNDDVLKEVSLWPAELTAVSQPIVISPETSNYKWANNMDALDLIKPQYKQALINLIQKIECHFNPTPCL